MDVQRKLYGRLLFSFSTDSGAFPSFSKGEPGEYPKAPPSSGLTAAGQNGTITLLNGKVRFPLPPLSRGIDRAGRHSFGIAAAGAACILIERKQGPEQNGTKPGRECPAAWEWGKERSVPGNTPGACAAERLSCPRAVFPALPQGEAALFHERKRRCEHFKRTRTVQV